MTWTKALRWAAAMTACAGCGGATAEAPPPQAAGKQTFAEAIAMICDVDRLAQLHTEEDPLSIGQKRSEWLAENVENPDGIYFKTMLSVKGPEDQASEMRSHAREVGLASCALADALEASAMGGIAP